MADEGLTKEELRAYTEVFRENNIIMNDVLALVEGNGGKLDDVSAKLDTNKKEIIDSIVGLSSEGERTTLNAIKKDTSGTVRDINISKIIIGAVLLVTAISTVLSWVIFRSGNLRDALQNKIDREVKIIQGELKK